jgi:hypothetical protein
MIEFLTNYAPELALFGAIIASIAPFLRSRKISDGNMIKTFSDVKGLASNIHRKEIDFTLALTKVDDLATKIQNDVNDSIKKMDNTILIFKEDEIYKKMLLGLSQLDELSQLLQNKDNTIASLKTTIKSINKKLGVMENERKL